MFGQAYRRSVVVLLIAGMIAGGCKTSDPNAEWGSKVAEYRPEWQPAEKKAPYSAVYVLWAWEPIRRPTTGPASRPVALLPGEPWELAHEVRQSYTSRGSPIGFRRVRGQLIGIAGPTTMPLALAHYTWRMLPGDPNAEADARRDALEGAVQTIMIVLAVCAVAAFVGFELHENRHHLFDDISISF